MRDEIVRIANDIHQERYRDAAILFAAGSIVRGEGTAYSDLDLVVVYERLPHAWRESFRHGDLPVEAFVHDPGTLRFFFVEIDGRSGVPSLPQMVHEGVEVPGPNALSAKLKESARSILDAGPPRWGEDVRRRKRYEITDQLDDLRAPRSDAEVWAAGTQLYTALADYYLRSRGLWSARGKAIPRALEQANTEVASRFGASFARLFREAEPADAIALAEELLQPDGGLLFEGYRLEAPADWTRPA